MANAYSFNKNEVIVKFCVPLDAQNRRIRAKIMFCEDGYVDYETVEIAETWVLKNVGVVHEM